MGTEPLLPFFNSLRCPIFRRDEAKTGDIPARVARNNRPKAKKLTPAEHAAQDARAYAMFCFFALQAIRGGAKRLGAKMVAERVRWECSITKTGTFKINNNGVSAMARKFMAENPQYAGVFETRGK